MSNRTFVLVGDWTWAQTKHCQQLIDKGLDRKGFKCYFLPTTNCKYDDVMRNINTENISQFMQSKGVPKDCNIGDFPNKPWCEQRVLYINQNGAGWYPTNKDIDAWINDLTFANFQQYKAVILSFVYRLQPNVRQIILKKIQNAFIKSFETKQAFNEQFNPFQSIAFPIRASDKCYDNLHGLNGEMECWSVDELDSFLYSIHWLKPSINSVIFTSEDMNFVDMLMHKIKQNEKYTKEGFEWNFIVNHDDTRPGIGSAKYRSEKYDALDIDVNETDSDFAHDVIVGALSSLLLQTSNAKYIVHTKSSSWLDNLWVIASQLNCESMFWSQQFVVNGFDDDDRRHFHFDKQCFELKQHGLLNMKTKWKHILYPQDIWQQIHVSNFNEASFKEKFGIDTKMNEYCQRYTEPPFVKHGDFGV